MERNMSYRYTSSDDLLPPAVCLLLAGIFGITSVFLYKPTGNILERILDYREVFGSFWRVLLFVILIAVGVICTYVGKQAYGWLEKLLAYGGLLVVAIALWRVLMPFVVAILIIGAALLLSDNTGRGRTSYNRGRRY